MSTVFPEKIYRFFSFMARISIKAVQTDAAAIDTASFHMCEKNSAAICENAAILSSCIYIIFSDTAFTFMIQDITHSVPAAAFSILPNISLPPLPFHYIHEGWRNMAKTGISPIQPKLHGAVDYIISSPKYISRHT